MFLALCREKAWKQWLTQWGPLVPRQYSLNTISYEKEPGLLERRDGFPPGAGMSLRYLVTLETRKLLKSTGVMLKSPQEPVWRNSQWSKVQQFEGAPNSQRWHFINKNNDCSRAKHIKYVNIPSLQWYFLKNPHWSPLEDTKEPNNFSKNWKCRRVNTPWGNPGTRTGVSDKYSFLLFQAATLPCTYVTSWGVPSRISL